MFLCSQGTAGFAQEGWTAKCAAAHNAQHYVCIMYSMTRTRVRNEWMSSSSSGWVRASCVEYVMFCRIETNYIRARRDSNKCECAPKQKASLFAFACVCHSCVRFVNACIMIICVRVDVCRIAECFEFQPFYTATKAARAFECSYFSPVHGWEFDAEHCASSNARYSVERVT